MAWLKSCSTRGWKGEGEVRPVGGTLLLACLIILRFPLGAAGLPVIVVPSSPIRPPSRLIQSPDQPPTLLITGTNAADIGLCFDKTDTRTDDMFGEWERGAKYKIKYAGYFSGAKIFMFYYAAERYS